jgi:hypothetical protein
VIFDKPAEEWTDTELRIGAVVVAHARDRAVRHGDMEAADRLAALAAMLAQHRDARRDLVRAIKEAVNPFHVLSAGIDPE